MMKLLVLAALVGLASASCPNACSGHGTCNQYSACECYRNWMSADCSQRQCTWAHSFIDLPQGDLNADGRIDIPNQYAISLCSDRSFFSDLSASLSTHTGGDAFVSKNKDQSLPTKVNSDAGSPDKFWQQGTSLKIHNGVTTNCAGAGLTDALGGERESMVSCTGKAIWNSQGYYIMENVAPADEYTASNDPHGVVAHCRERSSTLTYAIVVHVTADTAPSPLCEPNEWLRDDNSVQGEARFRPCIDIATDNESPDLLRTATLTVRTTTFNGAVTTDEDGNPNGGLVYAIYNGAGVQNSAGDWGDYSCIVTLSSDTAELAGATTRGAADLTVTNGQPCQAAATGTVNSYVENTRHLYVGSIETMTYDTQQTNVALWERYPADHGHASGEQGYASQGTAVGAVAKNAWDEAHFYAECSSKGLCDRSTGLCQCFAGFEGDGCVRTACPNDCSGHGVCNRLIDDDSSYAAWDAYKTQSCTCDAGYTGPNCALRECPKGDDPISRQHRGSAGQTVSSHTASGLPHTGHRTSSAEIQIFGIADHGALLTGKGKKGTRSAPFALEFTDMYGDKWTTETVNFRSDHGRSEAVVAADIEAALENLPNGVLSNVEVNPVSMLDPATITCDVNLDALQPGNGFGTPVTDMWNGGDGVNCRFADGASSGSGILNADILEINTISVDEISATAVHSSAVALRCLPAGLDKNDGANVIFPADETTVASDHDITKSLSSVTGRANVEPIVSGGHLVGLSICPGGVLAIDQSGSLGAAGNTISVAVDFDLLSAHNAANDALYAVTFVDNAGDIPMLGARFNWHMNVGEQSTQPYSHNSGDATAGIGLDGASPRVACATGTPDANTGRDTVAAVATGDCFFNDTPDLGATGFAFCGYACPSGVGMDCEGDYVALGCGVTQSTAAGGFPAARKSPSTVASGMYIVEDFKGDKEQDVCSNRGICDYSTGLCKCFAGFTKDDCSVQNSLSTA